MQKRKWGRLAATAVILILVTAGLWWLVGRPMVRFVSEPEKFRAWVDSHGIWGSIIFIGMVIFQVLVAVIPGEPFEIAAGYAFGAWEGTLYCILGAAAGSLLTFWLVRLFGMRLVRLFFEDEEIRKLRFLKASPKRDMLFLIIYIIPGTPKDLLGYVAGLTDMRLPVWMLICSLGRIPSVVTSTIGGNALGTQNYHAAAVVLAVTLVISGAGLAAYNWICKKNESNQ